jgi:hypothetical protein
MVIKFGKRITISILLVFIALLTFGQSTDTLHWSKSRKLRFDDFKDETIYYAGGGATLCYLEGTANSCACSGILAVFFKNKSAIPKGDISVLSHEQGHFDICEIYARKARKYLQSTGKALTSDSISVIVNRFNHDLELMQARYDEETDHNANADRQWEWEEKIARMLYELRLYEECTKKPVVPNVPKGSRNCK